MLSFLAFVPVLPLRRAGVEQDGERTSPLAAILMKEGADKRLAEEEAARTTFFGLLDRLPCAKDMAEQVKTIKQAADNAPIEQVQKATARAADFVIIPGPASGIRVVPKPSCSTEEAGFLSRLSGLFSSGGGSGGGGDSGSGRYYHPPGLTGIMISQREEEQKRATDNVDRQ